MNNRIALLRVLFASLRFSHHEGTKKTQREIHSLRNRLAGLLFFVGLTCRGVVFAQSDDSAHLSLSGSVDVYYAYYNDSLPSGSFRQTGTISPRSEQFGVNIAQARLAYDHPSVRGRLALHYGDIPLSSWSVDYPMLQEASVGVRLADGLWADGGFFPTHIGTESFLPGSNRISSIAAVTYFEPFYQSGLRVAWDVSEKLSAHLHLLSGYNSFIDRNSDKSVGAYLNWRPSENVGVVYTNLLGNEGPDSGTSLFRTYHNLQSALTLSDDFQMVLGFDFSTQGNSGEDGGTATAMGGLAILSYAVAPQWKVNGRFEFFDDPDGFLSGTFRNDSGEIVGPSLIGGTLGIEHRPTETSYIRLEGRLLRTSEETTFFGGDVLQQQRIEVGVTAGVAFNAPLF